MCVDVHSVIDGWGRFLRGKHWINRFLFCLCDAYVVHSDHSQLFGDWCGGELGGFLRTDVRQRTAAVQQAVDASVALARMKDSQDDYRAEVSVTVTPWNGPDGVGIFIPDANEPDPALAGDWAKHWAIIPQNHIRFATSLAGAYGWTKALNDPEIMIGANALTSTIIHEIAHSVGIDHNTTSNQHIMWGTGLPGQNKLLQSEANTLSGL